MPPETPTTSQRSKARVFLLGALGTFAFYLVYYFRVYETIFDFIERYDGLGVAVSSAVLAALALIGGVWAVVSEVTSDKAAFMVGLGFPSLLVAFGLGSSGTSSETSRASLLPPILVGSSEPGLLSESIQLFLAPVQSTVRANLRPVRRQAEDYRVQRDSLASENDRLSTELLRSGGPASEVRTLRERLSEVETERGDLKARVSALSEMERNFEARISELNDQLRSRPDMDELERTRRDLQATEEELADFERGYNELAKTRSPEHLRHLVISLQVGTAERYLIQGIRILEEAAKPSPPDAVVSTLTNLTRHRNPSVAAEAQRALRELRR